VNFCLMNNKYIKIGLVILVIGGLWGSLSIHNSNNSPQSKIFTPSDSPVGEPVKIIAFGDSLTAGYGVSQTESYPSQLETALLADSYNVRVINSGVSGETSRGNLERASFIRGQNPNVVVLGIGGNDALRTLPVQDTEKNIRATVEILQEGENPPKIILLQMKAPLNAGFKYKRTFDDLYKKIATDMDLVLVPFITEDIFLDKENKLSDGIHYNKIGYQKVIAQHVLPNVKKVLVSN
jgi:acyl-CoA thioesterase-1